jgi:PhnB protein
MADISVDPYLFFKGNCREAMEFYKGVFGGELEVMTMDQAPGGAEMPGTKPTDVMHASLRGPVNLMASDSPQANDETKKVELSLGGTDEARLREIFDGLADGGTVKSPLEQQFWGDTFGSLTDRYGVDWMMNIGQSQP